MPLVEVSLEDDRWAGVLEPLAERAGLATLAALGLAAPGFSISILGCDDARIAALNESFRTRAGPTNVLAWPGDARGAATEGGVPDLPQAGGNDPEDLGDIAIAWDTCAREAEEQGKPFADHVTHLIVHATLHLLGYDHIRAGDAARMETQEIAILAELGISDPYE